MPSTPTQFEAIAKAALACAAAPKDDYDLLKLMRAINAAPTLYTDDMYAAICDAAAEFGEDADGDIDPDATEGAIARGYAGNRYMADAMREYRA